MSVIDKQTKEETEQVVDQCVPVYHGIFMPIELNFFFHRKKKHQNVVHCLEYHLVIKTIIYVPMALNFFIEYKYERSKCNYPFVTLYYKKIYMFFIQLD